MSATTVEVQRQIEDAAAAVLLTKHCAGSIERAADECVRAIRNGRKILLCGNGGSAADAQHIAAELVNKYRKDRQPLPGLALTTDTSILTAIGNDYTYDLVFAKQVEALGTPGDVLVCITTSGNSRNVIEAAAAARTKGIVTIGLTGMTGGQLRDNVDILISIPNNETPRIQECQHVAYHILCDLIERECGRPYAAR